MKQLLSIVGLFMLLSSCEKSHDAALEKQYNEFSTKAGKTVEVFSSEDQFNSIISKSAERTFGSNVTFKLDRVDNVEVNNKLVSTVYYNTDKGQSTVLVVTDLSSLVKTVVDCTGSCDCRERLIISPNGTQTYECTCSSCKMTVEQV